MTESLRIEKLRREHNVDAFDCGQEPLNRFLVRFALQNQQAEASQTYVAMAGDAVVGFYTLVVAQVEYNDAPARLAKGLARHPIPLMLLARLAIARGWQGKRLGAGLLKDAMLRTLQATEIAGIRALAVHAKDDAGSTRSNTFPGLMVPLKTRSISFGKYARTGAGPPCRRTCETNSCCPSRDTPCGTPT